jgi:hypothetical protein
MRHHCRLRECRPRRVDHDEGVTGAEDVDARIQDVLLPPIVDKL